MPGWPDLLIGGIAAFFGWKGFRNGFVRELAGPVAVVIALVAAMRYPGSLDEPVETYLHVHGSSAHALGTAAFAILAYALVTVLAWLLGRVARLPLVRIVDALAGAAVGVFKALLGAWIVLYVVLLMPLGRDLRADLHHSPLVQLLARSEGSVDDTVEAFAPWFARPFLEPIFARHRI